MAATRPKYSQNQLEKYFDRISLPVRKRIFNIAHLDQSSQLSYLKLLQKHHLCKVPWENLTQHYSWHRVINVNPQHLYRKIVESPEGGRGGYCMEANLFFHTVLYSLNFPVIIAGARIHGGYGAYGGWTHCVNIVTIGGVRYMLDGGFGPQGPTHPVPLQDDVVTPQIKTAESRVLYAAIPEFLDRNQRVWIYQYRPNASADFTPMYCFTDLEFTPSDIESMNFAPWLNTKSFFTHKVVCVRFATSKETSHGDGPKSPDEEAFEDAEIDGSITMNQDVLKWKKGAEKIVELKFEKEAERTQALERYFGTVLSQEDKVAILGSASDLGGGGMGHDE
ncbi:arylamine N-acetyltransferase 3 [Teratosphaeria nubilosa]|uniref:Arylamine N-acetyltransferase 3 n=1 Tax=Teratosphaeria nubilosa TaxID=161662 RepID=A0A6G1L6Y6_9PEZI|nr:arylamine N-acetyltransferase 3 [Teratosphaeria nubilosa]